MPRSSWVPVVLFASPAFVRRLYTVRRLHFKLKVEMQAADCVKAVVVWRVVPHNLFLAGAAAGGESTPVVVHRVRRLPQDTGHAR